MDKEEKIEVIEDEEDNLPENYTEKDLDDDEKIQAQFNLESITMNFETSEFDLEMMKRQLASRLPQREAGLAAKETIRKKEIEVTQNKNQVKMYKRRVRTGKRRIPVIDNTPAESELVEEVAETPTEE